MHIHFYKKCTVGLLEFYILVWCASMKYLFRVVSL